MRKKRIVRVCRHGQGCKVCFPDKEKKGPFPGAYAALAALENGTSRLSFKYRYGYTANYLDGISLY